METENKTGMSTTSKWAIALLVELVIAVGLGIGYFHFWKTTKLEKLKVVELDRENLEMNEGANPAQQEFTNIAIFGIDARETDSMLEGNRSDTVMIASINNKTKEVKLVSLYRDSLFYVNTEQVPTAKLSHAYAYGGPQLAISALNHNLDLQISDFITVNFLALSKAIDELGGITINVRPEELPMLNTCITEQINITGVYSDGVFNAGEQVLNGTQATAWTRIRSTDQGDITRTERQRTVLSKMFEKAKASDVATIDHIIDEVFPCISTSMERDTFYELMKDMASYGLSGTVGFPFAFEMKQDEVKGSILVPADLSANVSALHEFLFGTGAYAPTQIVEQLSYDIQAETGVKKKEINPEVFTPEN